MVCMVCMVCNGEIYNYVELADMFGIPISTLRSDVDVVLHMLADVLEDAKEVARRVALLDGDFAFVLTDGTSQLLSWRPVTPMASAPCSLYLRIRGQ